MSTAGRVGLITVLVLIVVLGAIGYLFVAQNSERVTDLSLDLYFFAVHLKQPMQITHLLGISLGSGLLGGLILGAIAARRRKKPAVAATAASSSSDWT